MNFIVNKEVKYMTREKFKITEVNNAICECTAMLKALNSMMLNKGNELKRLIRLKANIMEGKSDSSDSIDTAEGKNCGKQL